MAESVTKTPYQEIRKAMTLSYFNFNHQKHAYVTFSSIMNQGAICK